MPHAPNLAMKFGVDERIVKAFNVALTDPENVVDGKLSWDFVSSDVHVKLGSMFNFKYLDDVLDILMDAVERTAAAQGYRPGTFEVTAVEVKENAPKPKYHS